MIKKLEEIMEWGGVKRDITFLFLSGAALLFSIFGYSPFSFDMAWIAIILCGVPIIMEALIGLVTAFDIKSERTLPPVKSHLLCSWERSWRI